MTQTSVDYSRMLNEQLYGTITHGDVFFLLEYNDPHTERAWEDAKIPQAVKDRLMNYRNSRCFLIRQPGQIGEVDRTITLFIVHASAKKPVIYRYSVYEYGELLSLNLDAVLRGDLVDPETNPVFAVCTNGKRDVCCSQYGIPIYNALQQHYKDQVWQASHIGGHRFAGTMFAFPHALCYGYLNAESAVTAVEQYTNGHLALDYLRGRAVYDQPIQAAEYYLRRHLNDETAIDSVRFKGYHHDDGVHQTQFAVGDDRYQVGVVAGESLKVLSTTGKDKYKDIIQWQQHAITQRNETDN